MDERDERFFEDIARGIDSWVEAAKPETGGFEERRPLTASYRGFRA
jgi:hypothetical protein